MTWVLSLKSCIWPICSGASTPIACRCAISCGQLGHCADALDAREFRRERLDARRIDAALVHAAQVEVGHFALRAAGGPFALAQRFDQASNVALVVLLEQGVHAPVGSIRRNRMRLDPAAIREAEEIARAERPSGRASSGTGRPRCRASHPPRHAAAAAGRRHQQRRRPVTPPIERCRRAADR